MHDPLDRGGETLNGIARKFHPNWEGWAIVDAIKHAGSCDTKQLALKLASEERLQNLVGAFYKKNFWDKMRLDEIESQVVANNLYLFGVNAGIARAVKFAQQIVGTRQDGMLGAKTLAAINATDEVHFKKAFDALEIAYYKGIVQRSPSQERFIKGWLRRAELV
ncbi:MAG: peptidoglycan domain protein [Helicobacter sp.]|nr:peptidoglycan domain protein [Helicobacter sp.]